MASASTIAAIATAPGRGGIGVIRLSGPAVSIIANGLLGQTPVPRHATLAHFQAADGSALDHGLALFFPKPNSFTGEDVLELHGHGGPVVLDQTLQRLLQLGAELARPGEFSERAFLNGKLDLAQAEAIADLIDSGSAAAAKAAMQTLQGAFSNQVQELEQQLIELRMYVEAAIDFPEEEIDFLADTALHKRIDQVLQRFGNIEQAASRGRLLNEGLKVVLAGQPNAGKSSLLNALAGHDAAIVTHVPGTTRDTLSEQIAIDGLPLHIVDTAGLRETDDVVEQHGIARTKRAIDQADAILLLVDDQQGFSQADADILAELPKQLPVLQIFNKVDLSDGQTGAREATDTQAFQAAWGISAKQELGMDEFRQGLKQLAGFQQADEGQFLARRRHLQALENAHEHVSLGVQQLQVAQAGELLAEELRLAQQDLGQICGEFTADDLLGQIFSSFCIGK